MGVLEKVEFADWAAPIVPVLKDDGNVRICGDYKMTINKASKVDLYPVPRVEDLFTAMSGGVSFSKLDLSHTYLQLQLEESSMQDVTINTHSIDIQGYCLGFRQHQVFFNKPWITSCKGCHMSWHTSMIY